MMNRKAVMQALKRRITDEIVVASYTCAFDWLEQGERALNYFSYGVMGLGSSHGLGLALGRPERKVVVLEGDGSLLMNFGTLVTIAATGAAELRVFHVPEQYLRGQRRASDPARPQSSTFPASRARPGSLAPSLHRRHRRVRATAARDPRRQTVRRS